MIAGSSLTCTKVALRREEGYPAGVRAPMYIVCPCGTKIPAQIDGMKCDDCGRKFDSGGWIVCSDYDDEICNDHGALVASTDEGFKHYAPLLASAPEMLAALQRAKAFLDIFEEVSEQAFGDWSGVRKQIVAALEKAKAVNA
jgi:hypothetical protein